MTTTPGPRITVDATVAIEALEEVSDRVARFAADMARAGIHVGIDGTCAVDGLPWPCPAQRPADPLEEALEAASAVIETYAEVARLSDRVDAPTPATLRAHGDAIDRLDLAVNRLEADR